MKHILVITSASYVVPDMQTEFGQIPPAFLPLGDGFLVAEQLRRLRDVPQDRYITLPADYVLSPWHAQHIVTLGLKPLFLDKDLSLGASVLAALESIEPQDATVHILHGDTIIDALACHRANVYSSHLSNDAYRWARLSDARRSEPFAMSFVGESNTRVMSGYFSFSSASDLMRAIHHEKDDFIAGVGRYHGFYPMAPLTEGEWLDFGHLQTYFTSRRAFLSKRAFNDIGFASGALIKTGSNTRKIAAEAAWFRALPAPLKLFAPQLIDAYQRDQREFYELEYLNLSTLGDLFVYGDAPLQRWEQIFVSCRGFLQMCQVVQPINPPDVEALYLPKTLERLNTVARELHWSLDAPWMYNGRRVGSLRDLAHNAAKLVPQPRVGLMHGDFCFSNILFDVRAQRIKVIDPRGFVTDDAITPYGDPLYDMAKLFHSAVGLYDLIIAGSFACNRSDNELYLNIFTTEKQRSVADMFRHHVLAVSGVEEKAVAGAAVLLFLSMIPLHYDHPARQEAFLANAFRIATLYGIGSDKHDRDSDGRTEPSFLSGGLHAAQIHAGGKR